MATPKYNLRSSKANDEDTKAALEMIVGKSFSQNKQVTMIPIESLEPYPKQKIFGMRDLDTLAENIKEIGITTPLIVRQLEVFPPKYQIVSGHRRKESALMAGLIEVPCIVETLDDDQADIYFTDNLYHREELLISERAFALKVQYEALKRKGGRPSEKNWDAMRPNLDNRRSVEILSEAMGEGTTKIKKYLRLTELEPELLTKVDNDEIPMTAGYYLAELNKEKQNLVLESMKSGLLKSISIDDAQRIVNFAEKISTPDDVASVLEIPIKKRAAKAKELTYKLKPTIIKKYFPEPMSPTEFETMFIMIAEFYEEYKDKVGDNVV